MAQAALTTIVALDLHKSLEVHLLITRLCPDSRTLSTERREDDTTTTFTDGNWQACRLNDLKSIAMVVYMLGQLA